MDNDLIWITKDGRKIPVKNLEFSHLLAINRILAEQIEDLEDSDELWDNPRLYRGNFSDIGMWRTIISQEIQRRAK